MESPVRMRVPSSLPLDRVLEEIQAQRIVSRIWERDHTVWADEPTEIENRLGWLDIADRITDDLPDLLAFAADVSQTWQQVVLMGMGGSSLAPEALSLMFDGSDGLPLTVLDSTHPDLIRERTAHLDPARTGYIVATKSGGTAETLAAFHHCYRQAHAALGDQAARQFVAITDPGSRLEALASKLGFLRTFLNDPDIGGRFSALSFFGLVPAALLGLDVAQLVERGRASGQACANSPTAGTPVHPATRLGALLGAAANEGRTTLTLTCSAKLRPLLDWIEQLVAESTGKDGAGILPVVGASLRAPSAYRDDQVFVDLRLPGDTARDAALDALADAGHPVAMLVLDDLYDVGRAFFDWEFATAVASHVMGVHPFDQPDVESAKVAARDAIQAYTDHGALPQDEAVTLSASTLADFVEPLRTGGYLAVHAYANPTAALDRTLGDLQRVLGTAFGVTCTVGYAPRLLHSTGQLHKGDAGSGRVLQLRTEPQEDVPIPDGPGSADAALSFGVLLEAQAVGDAAALRKAGRSVLTATLGAEPASTLEDMVRELRPPPD